MYVIGVATSENNVGYRNYIKSVEKNRLTPLIMGLGEKWKKWVWRTEMYIRALEMRQDYPDEILAITDVYDVVFLGGLNHIKAKYLELTQDSRRVVFGMENVCGGNCVGKIIPEGALRYINAGCSVGYPQEMLKVWKRIHEGYSMFHTNDDQYTLGTLMRRDSIFRNMITMDTEGILIRNVTFFQSLKGYDSLDGVPIVHFPGALQWPSKLRLFNNTMQRVGGEQAEFDTRVTICTITLFTIAVIVSGVYIYKPKNKPKSDNYTE